MQRRFVGITWNAPHVPSVRKDEDFFGISVFEKKVEIIYRMLVILFPVDK